MADQISIRLDETNVAAGSAVVATVNFRTRSTASASAPTSIRYRVDCLTNRRQVIADTSVSAASSFSITIPGPNNGTIDDSQDVEIRQLTVIADYGLDTQVKAATTWRVRNIRTFIPGHVFQDDFRLEPYYPISAAETAAGLDEDDLDTGEYYGDVRRYGAVGDGVTDDTAAIQNAVAVINSAGGGSITFQRTDYLVWGSVIEDLMTFSGTRGVAIYGNGARLVSGQEDGSAVYAIRLNSSCLDTYVENLTLVGGNTALDPDVGEVFCVALSGSRRITLVNCESYDCNTFFGSSAPSGVPPALTASTRVYGIEIVNCYAESTYYGIATSGNGDELRATLKTLNCGRSYFPWNVRNHDVTLESRHGGPFSDCLLKVYVDTTWGYIRLENIKLRYASPRRHTSGSNQNTNEALIAFDVQQAGATNQGGAIVDGIDITFDVEAGNSPTHRRLFIMRRYDENGAEDTTSRSHSFFNWRLSGVARSAHNFTEAVISLFDLGTWTGDFASGFTLEDINLPGVATQDAIIVDGTPFSNASATFSMRNVIATGDIELTGFSSAAKVHFENAEGDLFNEALSPTQLAANTDNYAPTGWGAWVRTLRLSTDASRNLTGISRVANNHGLRIVNVGAQDLVLMNEVTSTAANRFLLGADITLGANEGIDLWYDGTSTRWRAVGRHN